MEIDVQSSKKHTPSARVGVIDGGIDVAKIDFAHKTVDLQKNGSGLGIGKNSRGPTFSWREKEAKRDWRYIDGRTWRASCSGRSTMMCSPAGSQRIMC